MIRRYVKKKSNRISEILELQLLKISLRPILSSTKRILSNFLSTKILKLRNDIFN